MVAGTDSDARVVQYGGRVVRMNPVDVEADDSGAVLRPVKRDSRDGGKGRSRLRNKRGFMRMDGVQRQLFDPVDRSVQANGPDDVRRAGFEPSGGIEESC